ncbi:MAG: hypothetical protein AAF587_29665 [Bacteroidota bacterium]
MARTIQEIYDSIIQEKESMTQLNALTPLSETNANLLSDLTSTSKVAIWRLMIFLFSVATYTLEALWDSYKADVQVLLDNQIFGTNPWYVKIAKQFQSGYTLTVINDQFQYATVDESAQIVTHASATDSGGFVFIKAAKDGSGSLEPLTANELTEFSAYMEQVKIAGVQMIVSSLDPDALRWVAEIGYDPILPAATVQTNIESQVQDFLQTLPFDGTFNRLDFEDVLQQVNGVETVDTTSLQAYVGTQPNTIDQEYISASGYMTFDSANSTITMTPS